MLLAPARWPLSAAPCSDLLLPILHASYLQCTRFHQKRPERQTWFCRFLAAIFDCRSNIDEDCCFINPPSSDKVFDLFHKLLLLDELRTNCELRPWPSSLLHAPDFVCFHPRLSDSIFWTSSCAVRIFVFLLLNTLRYCFANHLPPPWSCARSLRPQSHLPAFFFLGVSSVSLLVDT